MSARWLSAALLLAGPALAAPDRLEVRDLFARPLIEGNRPEGAVPSPDGRHVAFVWNAGGERSPSDLWLVDADGARPPVNLTHLNDPTPEQPGSARPAKRKKGDSPRLAEIDSFDWSPRGDFLAFTALGQAGIAAARGEYIVMGDADDSYDFRAIPRFFDKLQAGFEYVQGCRLSSGGGRVLPGAMPWSHQYFGNPLFSKLAQTLLNVPLHDVYCGLRGFTKTLYDQLQMTAGGMEFAIEMVVQAAAHHARSIEIPVTLRPDGRKSHGPHLRTLRDGCRTLRYLLRAWWSARQSIGQVQPAPQARASQAKVDTSQGVRQVLLPAHPLSM